MMNLTTNRCRRCEDLATPAVRISGQLLDQVPFAVGAEPRGLLTALCGNGELRSTPGAGLGFHFVNLGAVSAPKPVGKPALLRHGRGAEGDRGGRLAEFKHHRLNDRAEKQQSEADHERLLEHVHDGALLGDEARSGCGRRLCRRDHLRFGLVGGLVGDLVLGGAGAWNRISDCVKDGGICGIEGRVHGCLSVLWWC